MRGKAYNSLQNDGFRVLTKSETMGSSRAGRSDPMVSDLSVETFVAVVLILLTLY